MLGFITVQYAENKPRTSNLNQPHKTEGTIQKKKKELGNAKEPEDRVKGSKTNSP